MLQSTGAQSQRTTEQPAPQSEGISSSVLSLFYCPAFTYIHDYWKTIALTRHIYIAYIAHLIFDIYIDGFQLMMVQLDDFSTL